jgi:hypothetical protein
MARTLAQEAKYCSEEMTLAIDHACAHLGTKYTIPVMDADTGVLGLTHRLMMRNVKRYEIDIVGPAEIVFIILSKES